MVKDLVSIITPCYNGEKVISQLPESGNSLSQGGTVILYTDSEQEAALTLVPDFSGMSVGQANSAAAEANLNIEFAGNFIGTAGSSFAYKQSIEAGREIKVGTVITVYFRENSTIE